MRNLSIIFTILLFASSYQISIAAGGDPLKDFEKWEWRYLNQAYVNCSEKNLSLYDEFNGDNLSADWQTHLYGPKEEGLYCRLHTNSAEEIFMHDNVNVENGLLKLTARWEEVNWKGVQRSISTGMVQTKKGFSFGKYEIRCKMMPENHVWTAFWMWSIEEIDIVDVATRKYYSNAMHGNGYSQSHPEINLPIDLDDDFHTYACEWTPFKVDYYFDGKKTATFYRFYKTDKTPLDIHCGDVIPQGIYKLNPTFPKITRRFKPIAWIAIEKACWHGDCDCDDDNDPHTHCGPKIDQEDLPSTFEVDYIKVEERAYDLVFLNPGCFLKNSSSQEICIDLKSQQYNHNLPENTYEAVSWELSENVEILNQSENKLCLKYLKPLENIEMLTLWEIKNDIIINEFDLPYTTLENAFQVSAVLKDDEGKEFTIAQKIHPCFNNSNALLKADFWKFIAPFILILK